MAEDKDKKNKGTIHTMPDKFIVPEEKQSKTGLWFGIGGGLVLIIVIVVVVLSVTGSADTPTPIVVAPPSDGVEQPLEPNGKKPDDEVKPPVEDNGDDGENGVILPPFPTALFSTTDSDQDNLTDEEEKIYNTGINKPDSDGDGFLDGQEVENLFNPLGTAPVLLEELNLVRKYSNPSFDYSVLFPASWLARALDDTNREVLFTALTGEFFQIIIQDNPDQQSAINWYLERFPETKPTQLERIFIQNVEGVWNPSKMTVYLAQAFGEGARDKIYVISYNAGTKTEVNFRTTFRMVINSFRLQ